MTHRCMLLNPFISVSVVEQRLLKQKPIVQWLLKKTESLQEKTQVLKTEQRTGAFQSCLLLT